nr:hypothetical protein BaRGS_009190 [Batillaria attramentaria]
MTRDKAKAMQHLTTDHSSTTTSSRGFQSVILVPKSFLLGFNERQAGFHHINFYRSFPPGRAVRRKTNGGGRIKRHTARVVASGHRVGQQQGIVQASTCIT